MQAQVRATLPVFWGMRGSTRTMFRVGFVFHVFLQFTARPWGPDGAAKLEPDAEPGVGVPGVVLDGLGHKAGGGVGGGAQHVAPQQGTGDDGPENVPGTGEAAVNVEMAHHKGLVPGAGAAHKFAMGRPVTTTRRAMEVSRPARSWASSG